MNGYWLDLGMLPYRQSFEIQEQILEARMEGILPSTIIFQQNPKTITVGRSGSQRNVLASSEQLAKHGIELVEANRGGDVTYHGPGQIIASPLFYLGDLSINAVQYMHRLEDVLVRVLSAFNIESYPREEYPGVWVATKKIGSVGVAVRHGYTFHGVSLNVNLDLQPFNFINPCGMVGLPVTSMHLLLGKPVSIQQVLSAFVQALEGIFDIRLTSESWSGIRCWLDIAKCG